MADFIYSVVHLPNYSANQPAVTRVRREKNKGGKVNFAYWLRITSGSQKIYDVEQSKGLQKPRFDIEHRCCL